MDFEKLRADLRAYYLPMSDDQIDSEIKAFTVSLEIANEILEDRRELEKQEKLKQEQERFAALHPQDQYEEHVSVLTSILDGAREDSMRLNAARNFIREDMERVRKVLMAPKVRETKDVTEQLSKTPTNVPKYSPSEYRAERIARYGEGVSIDDHLESIKKEEDDWEEKKDD